MVKVIGAGLGRTGTMSLKVALEQVGLGPCYHMSEVFAHPEHVALWQAAGDGQPAAWETLFAGYAAAVDFPPCAFYEELIQVYPAAKVVLTVRDPEQWYKSASSTIFWAGDLTLPPHMEAFPTLVQTLFGRTFGGPVDDRQRTIAAFERHNRAVQDRVPAERLLVYNVRDGWEPLCRFLGVPVPEGQPFPRLNDSAGFKKNVDEGRVPVERA